MGTLCLIHLGLIYLIWTALQLDVAYLAHPKTRRMDRCACPSPLQRDVGSASSFDGGVKTMRVNGQDGKENSQDVEANDQPGQ
jgi:hypothetical protein